MLVNPYAFGGATGSSIVAGSAPTSDQWRLLFPFGASGATDRLELFEIEMRSTSGGADQTTGGTPAVTVIFAGTAANLFDSNTSTSTQLVGNDGDSASYTFTSAKSIVEFTVLGSNTQSYWNPAQIILQYWNGSAWKNAYTSITYNTTDWPTSTTKTFTITAPTYTVAPSISYTFLAVGDTLTGNVGTYSNAEVVTYQWKRNGAAISGATSTSYTLVSADIGAQITFAVYIENGAGAYTGTSASVGPIISAPVYTTQSVEFSDTSTVTLSDSSTLEMYNRTA